MSEEQVRGDATIETVTEARPASTPPVAVYAPKATLFGVSDVGKVRKHNEDSFLAAQLERTMRVSQTSREIDPGAKVKGPVQGWIMIVCDGMGGHAAGEVASAMTVDALARYVFTQMPWGQPQTKEECRSVAHGLREAVKAAQAQVRDAAAAGAGRAGMGTTLTLGYVTWPNLFVVHVGDSRMYAYREKAMHQVTRDHTLAQQLVDSKVMSPAEAETSDFSNILVNAVGGDSDELKVELHHAMMFPGDVLLICSDGLTKHVDRDFIQARLAEISAGGDAEAGARALIQKAIDEGGTDNVTVVIGRF
jgi:serine/threonine protein phosphatase PrpC